MGAPLANAVMRALLAMPTTRVAFGLAEKISLVPESSLGSATASFTRATNNKAGYDFEGNIFIARTGEVISTGSRRVRNFLTNTESAAAWAHTGGGSISSGVSDPDGGTGALTVTAGSANEEFYNQVAGVLAIGHSVRPSVWIRRRTGVGTISLANTSGGTFTTLAISASWQRFTTPVASAVNTIALVDVKIATIGDAVDIYHPQVEDVTGQSVQTPGNYVSGGVLSSPYHGAGADGVEYFDYQNGNTVASNVVTEAQGAAIADATFDGFKSDQAITNYLGITEAPATQTTGSLGAGDYTLWMTGSGSAAVAAGSAAVTGAGAATDGSPVTFTVTSPGTVIVTVTGSPTRFQINGGSFVKCYVRNTGAAGTSATANADVLQYASTSNLPTNDFTVYGEVKFPAVPPAANYWFFGTYVDANNQTGVLWDGTDLIARRRISGTNHDAAIAFSPSAGTRYKWAARFSAVRGTDIFFSGSKGANDSTATDCQIGANFQIGADGNGANQPFANQKNFKIYNKALHDQHCETMTT